MFLILFFCIIPRHSKAHPQSTSALDNLIFGSVQIFLSVLTYFLSKYAGSPAAPQAGSSDFPSPEDPQEIQLRRACRRNKTPHPEPIKTVHFHPSCMSRQNDRPSGFPISAHQPVNQRTLSRVPRDLHRTEVFRVCPKIRLLRKDLPDRLSRLPLFIRIRNPRNRYESL